MKKPTPAQRKVLVQARGDSGNFPGYGPGSKEAWDLMRAGFFEEVGGHFELTLRGQDAADDAIRLAK